MCVGVGGWVDGCLLNSEFFGSIQFTVVSVFSILMFSVIWFFSCPSRTLFKYALNLSVVSSLFRCFWFGALCVLGKHSTTEINPQPWNIQFIKASVVTYIVRQRLLLGWGTTVWHSPHRAYRTPWVSCPNLPTFPVRCNQEARRHEGSDTGIPSLVVQVSSTLKPPSLSTRHHFLLAALA